MCDTAHYGTSSSLQHSIKQEIKYEEGYIKSEVMYEEEDGIKAESTLHEDVSNLNNSASCDERDLSEVIQCWVCETDYCEHVQFANFTTVKEEPVEETTQLEEQRENQESEHNLSSDLPPAPHPKIQAAEKHINYCSQCDYKCNVKQHLQYHIRAKHTGEYLFSCSQCDYKCNINQHLQRHIRAKHTGEYLFSCSQCDYKCNINQNLQRHIRAKHTTEYLFSCSQCDYKCNRKQHLQRHISAKHTGEYLLSCSQCDYQCNINQQLQNHIRAKHTGEYLSRLLNSLTTLQNSTRMGKFLKIRDNS